MKRKPFKIDFVQLAMTLLLAFVTQSAWAWSGSGTSSDPYMITSTSDWNTLATNVNGGNNYSGKFFRLTNDISVTTMVGNSETNSFRGTFDGYGYTLNISYDTSSDFTAPFRYIQGATFKNLKVTGTITTTMNLAAGIAGLNTNAVATFEQCVTDVTINSSSNTVAGWDHYDYHGGFLARSNSANVNITDCVCGGSVNGSSSSLSFCGGFVGVAVSCTVSATRCLSTTSFTNVNGVNSLCHTASAERSASVFYYVNGNDGACPGTQVTVSDLENSSYATALQAGRTTTIWVQQASIHQPMLNLFAFNRASDGYYLIGSEQEWCNFASLIETIPTANARMTADISVTTMVGNSESNSFRGTFDGYGHTLTISYNTTSDYTAPFRYIQGATFKNLKVTGTITTTMNLAAGIAGLNTTAVATFDQCATDVAINSSSSTCVSPWSRYDYHGGLLARSNNVNVNITDCVCGGSVNGSSSSSSNCASFVGVAKDCTVSATRCLSTTSYTNVYSWNPLCHVAGAIRNASVLYYVNGNDVCDGATKVTLSDLNNSSYATALQAGRATTIWVQQSSINQPMLNLFAFNKSNDDYYLIGSEQEWRNFSSILHTIPTANARMTANISATTMIGSSDIPFSGTFDGNGYTLTVAYNTSEGMTGPFRYTRGATIMNLHTAGTIITSEKFAGGLIGFAYNANTITNCRSSVYITSSVSGDGTHGGFIGDNEGSETVTTFTGCVFDGKLLGSSTNCCGGFVGWCSGQVRLSLTNCLYAPQQVTISESGSQTFSRASDLSHIFTTNCYYSQPLGGEQGKKRYQIIATKDVTINGLGSATATYNVSGITAYSHGIKYNELYYAGGGESVSLNLSHTSHAGYDYRYSVTSGSLTNPTTNNPTLTMPAATVIIQVSYSASKSITGYSSDENGWYLISSPMAETVNPTSVTNMLSNTYDLFRFNQNAEMEWQNYKIHNNDAQNPFNALVSGQGYLYANSEDVTLTFFGTPYNGDGVVDLEYSDDNTDSRMWGWNLIGNPFGTTATIDKDFYRMNDDHTEIIAATDNNIAPMEGVLVHATGSGQNVTFTTGGSKGGEKNCDNIIINLEHSNGTVIDRAIVSFDEGRTLPKLQIDENNTKIYIPQDGEDYAIAFSDKTGELPLHFVAKEIGRYTISVETHGRASLHVIKLIDNFENITIDLNENNNYTFIGSPADSRDRFVIVFVETQNFVSPQDDIFAYQNGSDIIVNGEGELQVFDVMGRIIMQKHVNGVEMVRKPSKSGVYIFRLNGKTQKIVIR